MVSTNQNNVKMKEAKKIRLDIDLISEELYQMILEEFQEQHPEIGDATIDDWEITAIAEGDQEDELDRAEIQDTTNKLYRLLVNSEDSEAETMVGYLAQFKEYWETGTPMDEQEA